MCGLRTIGFLSTIVWHLSALEVFTKVLAIGAESLHRTGFQSERTEGGILDSIAIPTSVPMTDWAFTPIHSSIPSGLQRACLAAKTAIDNKAENVTILDLRKLTPVFDFFVIATGNSRRQVHTIVEEIDATLRSTGDERLAIEGYDTSKWVIQDYGDVMVHVFDPETRDYYQLEELWADAPVIDWEDEIDE